MAEAAFITVYAQFPKIVVPNTELDLNPNNWEWNRCLSFPVGTLNALQFSYELYKWIRYATGIVTGARGELCTEQDLTNPIPIDYDSALSATSIDLYYHTTDQEKRRMFPIDPRLADTRTVASSEASTCRDNFCGDVEDRDESCVVTGDPPEVCQAAHLLPRSLGDTYIEMFSTYRRQGPSCDDEIVRHIDDVRNGLFLTGALCLVLGTQLAFLKTPNFAMDTTDVDPDADSTQVRFTSHQFQSLELVAAPSGSALRIPSDLSYWPPTALFEAVYASAVVHHFGVTDNPEKWVDVFYPGGLIQAAHADHKSQHSQVNINNNKDNSNGQVPRCYERHHRWRGKHDAVDPYDVLINYRFKAMGPERVRTYMKRCEEMVATRERKGLEDKVNLWRASLAPQNDHVHGHGRS